METISGKQTVYMDHQAFRHKQRPYRQTWIDIGTGDGQFVLRASRANREVLSVGLDACRENLVESSRKSPDNTLFVIANALAIPAELSGSGARITINFPWGSLLQGLLTADKALLGGLCATAAAGALLEVRLNHSALAEAGWPLDEGGAQVMKSLRSAGCQVTSITSLGMDDLRRCPTTWSKKLAYGRSAQAVELLGVWK